MKREKSCGAVIFRIRNGQKEYLLEKMIQGHYAFCKGHVEGNETEHETAIREIAEETNLTVRFIDGFRETTSYSPGAGTIKEVVYFVGEALNWDNLRVQLEEVSSIVWMSYPDAVKAITYANDRELLNKANRFIEEEI